MRLFAKYFLATIGILLPRLRDGQVARLSFFWQFKA